MVLKSNFNFPNVRQIASYSPISQTINFNDYSKKHMENLIGEWKKNKKFDISQLDISSTIIHEAAHCFDNLVTLSGQYMLSKTYDAINELKSKESTKLVELMDLLQKWNHGHYVNKDVDEICDTNSENWSYKLDSGFAYNGNGEPNGEVLIRTVFAYKSKFLCNVPFSIEALWETNAIWAELWFQISAILFQDDEDLKLVEMHRLKNKYSEFIYNSKLLVYSCAAHYTSNFKVNGELIEAYFLSKALTTISLNLPLKYYSKIKEPKKWIFNGVPQMYLSKAKRLNPPMIFAILLENVLDEELSFFKKDTPIDINEILLANGLPNKEILNKEILKEMKEISTSDKNGEYNYLYNFYKETGIHLFEIHGLEGGINVNPYFFADIVNQMDCCVYQNDMEETEAYNRMEEFRDLEYALQVKYEKIRGNNI